MRLRSGQIVQRGQHDMLQINEKRVEQAQSMKFPLDGGIESQSSWCVSFHLSLRKNRELLSECLELFHQNMADMYAASSWGLNMKSKRGEFRHLHARFLIVRSPEGKVVAFCHFRFCMIDEAAVLYVYELQVRESARGCGHGRRLMTLMEDIAFKTGMSKIVLTVFKSNIKAIGFYSKAMNYSIDADSPSRLGEDDDYEIMSKEMLYNM
mmetsp:Transcript_34592/g.53098  ORF Transcript_34592/g.53098 Transcript_34592/m.53098 type:complete len:209 (-) Transcript_34592:175-801(-)|eukprot:CAMPEP_0118710370 /NCGR_PEP_ID=MMETSP0800-20121206/23321_1 /TAXON_ID=210618 ORGANISM="Striatella unipunctata, Strain CCMP2910" /NCGR_SAMPLE_ID=MMETSP0800 /ASSEMBLY_ACC=CAM_ASM_000638 /LENGTH=208 /DNA_ID=CAMNT_0006614499 /DNA_START=111 /DNA_END=740 /DNA_ORIENTATION=-